MHFVRAKPERVPILATRLLPKILYWCKCTCQEKVSHFTFAGTNCPI